MLAAWTTLQGAHPVGPGSKVLTLGTGSVSWFAAIPGQALSGEVIATNGHDDKRARLAVTEVFNYTDDRDWGRAVFDRLGGVDEVVNAACAGSINAALQAFRVGGEVATIGLFSFGSEPIDIVTITIKGASARDVGHAETHANIVQPIDERRLKPPNNQVLPF